MVNDPPSRHASRRPQAGVALVVVLATLILLVGLIVAILSRVTAGRTVATAYSNSVNCRVLADTAVNVVIGQIHDATSSDPTGAIGWASQPGAVRTYSGNIFKTGYKLFSSSNMTVPGGSAELEAAFANGVDLSQWAAQPGQFVNLNQPALKNGVKIYPIADPAILATDPSSPNYVQGFSIKDTTQPYEQNLEMPVEWIYVREDGTLATGKYQASNGSVALTGGNDKSPVKARMAFWTDDETSKINVNTASEGFYWDTPRVNTRDVDATMVAGTLTQPDVGNFKSDPSIGTTAVGTTSASTSTFDNIALIGFKANGTDQGLAFNPPAQNEYNRFPGHPAMTSLSAAFPLLSPNQILSIVPRLTNTPPNGGGSMFGSRSVVENGNALYCYPDTDRLYDSESEITLHTDPTAPIPSTVASPSRTLNIIETAGTTGFQAQDFTPDVVNKRRFVLTANSRAPELNLFGRPRVAMWPVAQRDVTITQPNTVGATRTPFDELIAFCGTLTTGDPTDKSDPSISTSKWPFVFFRNNAYSLTEDAKIPSNVNLYSYLQDVTNKPVPGFGGSLQTKYASIGGVNQILTEILDYIRCTNIFDASLEPPIKGQDFAGGSQGGEYTNGITPVDFYTNNKPIVGYAGHGQVLPLRYYNPDGTVATSGLGRMPTVTEVALHFICTADGIQMQLNQKTNPTNVYPVYSLNGQEVPVTADNQYVGINANVTNNLTLKNPDGKSPILLPGHRRVQGILDVELSTPMEGYPHLNPCIEVEILGAEAFTLNGQPLFRNNAITRKPVANHSLFTYDSRVAGGPKNGNSKSAILWSGISASSHLGIFNFVMLSRFPGSALLPADKYTSIPIGYGSRPPIQLYEHPFISEAFDVFNGPDAVDPPVPKAALPQSTFPPMSVGPASLTINLYYPPDGLNPSVANRILYQTLHVNFPTMSVPVPLIQIKGQNPVSPSTWCFNQDGYTGDSTRRDPGQASDNNGRNGGRLSADRAFTLGYFSQVFDYVGTLDSIRSMQLADGDFRLTSTMSDVSSDHFKVVGSGTLSVADSTTRNLHSFSSPFNNEGFFQNTDYMAYMDKPSGRYVGSSIVDPTSVDTRVAPDFPNKKDYPVGSRKPRDTGDWDTGMGPETDGPMANMPDAGQLITLPNYKATFPPYFWYPEQDTGPVTKAFSPNRQVPSSGMFGSLPAGGPTQPWRTLLFRPPSVLSPHPSLSPQAPDHLFMDLFWMPVVQPYAISEPFSTAGKINMNYQILPFTYINRQTAMYAVLKAERMLSIPAGQGAHYKSDGLTQPKYAGTVATESWRHLIDIPHTLSQFDDRFKSGSLFKSATEICDQYIVPIDPIYPSLDASQMDAYWQQDHFLTGDNVRERPYANIYPRLTTQSNTFRVHYWVQTVKQVNKNPNVFTDPDSPIANGQRDVVTGQLRGSTIVERFLNSNDPRFVAAPATSDGINTFNPLKDSLNAAYKMRVYGGAIFAP